MIDARATYARSFQAPGLGIFRSRYQGFAARPHHHPEAQLIVPLAGRMHMVAGARAAILGPEMAVWLPPGLEHGFTHVDGAVDYVVVEELAPRWPGLVLARAPALWHLAQALALELEEPRPDVEALVEPLFMRVGRAATAALAGTAEVTRLVELVLAGYMEDLRVPDLAAAVGLSPRQLERRCLAELGRTPKRFLQEVRLGAAERLLTETTWSVARVALAVGIANPSHFAASFKAWKGCLPGDARRAKIRP